MSTQKDYLGETLRLVERGREDVYFRKLDQQLIAHMRQQEAAHSTAATGPQHVFTPILVPVDFSPYATEALGYAADLAEVFHASLIVLHVIASELKVQATPQRLEHASAPGATGVGAATTLAEPRAVTEVVIDEHREHAYTTLQNFLPPRLARYSVELRVVLGRPFERIVETAVHAKVGLIVLGTHGRTGLDRVAMGSVAERVVRLAPCPVFTVKAATPESTHWLQGFYQSLMRSPHP